MATSWSRATPAAPPARWFRLVRHVEQLLKLCWLCCVTVVGPSWLCTLLQAAVSMRPELTKSQGSEGSRLSWQQALVDCFNNPPDRSIAGLSLTDLRKHFYDLKDYKTLKLRST